jgi:hypothetical protein
LARASAGRALGFATDVPIEVLHSGASEQSICDQLCSQY